MVALWAIATLRHARHAPPSAGKIGTTDFKLKPAQKAWLLQSGRDGAKAFLATYKPAEYGTPTGARSPRERLETAREAELVELLGFETALAEGHFWIRKTQFKGLCSPKAASLGSKPKTTNAKENPMAIYVETPPEVDPGLPEEASDADVLTRAETAECTCPEFCERDHDNE
jgi:hypothetical protein